MKPVLNHPSQKMTRQALRRAMPVAEVMLWQQLRKGQLGGAKFRRQHGIGAYIVDLYCPAAHLVVEVDGDTHFQTAAREHDRWRDAYIRSQGISVLRVTNLAVYHNMGWVLSVIRQALRQPPVVPLGKGDIEWGRDLPRTADGAH